MEPVLSPHDREDLMTSFGIQSDRLPSFCDECFFSFIVVFVLRKAPFADNFGGSKVGSEYHGHSENCEQQDYLFFDIRISGPFGIV